MDNSTIKEAVGSIEIAVENIKDAVKADAPRDGSRWASSSSCSSIMDRKVGRIEIRSVDGSVRPTVLLEGGK